MIVVRIELWPFGDARYAQAIDQIIIWNTAEVDRGRHRYEALIGDRHVTLLHRRGAGALVLVKRVVQAWEKDESPASADPAATAGHPW